MIVYDEARFVKNSINNISQALVFGAILAFIVLVPILRNIKSPLILVTSVPISVLATFMLMYAKNITMNMMSLGGLSLGIGMLFDSGNVVLAAINHNRQKGLPPKEAALQGASEVTASVTSAILTTIIVFLPIIFLKGIIGIVFADLALTICFSLGISLLVSLTFIPMLSSLDLFSRTKKLEINLFARFKQVSVKAEKIEKKIIEYYGKRLDYFLDHPWNFFGIVLLCLSIALFIIPRIEREFIPKVDVGEFELIAINPKSTSIERSKEIGFVIDQKIRSLKDVESVITQIGYDEDQILKMKGGDIGSHKIQMRVVLKKERKRSTRELIAQIRIILDLGKDIKLYFHESGDILTTLLAPGQRDITLEIEGDDLSILKFLGKRIKQDLLRMERIKDVKMSMEDKAKEFHVTFDDLKLSSFNFNHENISSFLQSAIKGNIVSNLQLGDDEIDIRLFFQEKYRRSVKDIESFKIKSADGQSISLANMIKIDEKTGYTSIIRKGQKRINRITANIDGREKNQLFEKVDQYKSRIILPEGYKISFGGEKEDMEKSQRNLLFSMLLAILLIYMVLAGQFESLKIPIIMMGVIPLIVIGVAPSLFLSGKSLNISSFIGIILLMGTVVDSASLYYEYLEHYLQKGLDAKSSALESAKIILKPVIMNSSTTILGLLPIALEIGEGTEFQSPMAIAVIGGMSAAVFLSLIFLPIAFFLLIKGKRL